MPMPAPTPETLQKKVENLKKSLAEQGEGMEAVQRRRARKQLRRTQRKHRRLAAEATRLAGKAEQKQEAPAEQAES
jgi:hypothetical protein